MNQAMAKASQMDFDRLAVTAKAPLGAPEA
jgi:hypothetical protein